MKKTRRACVASFGLAALVCVLVASTLAACKHKVDNRLIIVKAVWSDMLDEHPLDVTQQVASLVKGNALKLTANTATLGDPAPFKLKKLVVEWSKDGVHAKRRAAEGESILVASDEMPPKPRLRIKKATYGSLVAGKTIDVTNSLSDLVNANALSIRPGNALFGDPAPMQFKQLQVDYSFDGVATTKTGGEDQLFTLP